jgi:hypothetical protein
MANIKKMFRLEKQTQENYWLFCFEKQAQGVYKKLGAS